MTLTVLTSPSSRSRLAMRTRPHVRTSLALLLFGALTTGAAAQPATSAPPAGRFLVSVGSDALASDFGDASPGIAAQAGYERRIGGATSPFSLRVAGDYWRAGRTFTATREDVGGPLDVRRTTTLVGGSLLGVLRLPRLGTVRPYALGGLGVQQFAQRNETDWVPLVPNAASKIVYLPPVRVNTISYTAGLGASATIGRVTPFAEARLTHVPGLGGYGASSVRAPVTLGMRF